MDCLQKDYDYKLRDNLGKSDDDIDKILVLFAIFFSKSQVLITQKKIYEQFLIACLLNPSDRLLEYNVVLRQKYTSLISEINPNVNSENIYDSIVGFFIASITLNNYDLEHKIKNFIHNQIQEIKI